MQPDLAYAYTLCGHEYSANDDFEKAMAFYRSAIRIDERHYNAWYGTRLGHSASHAQRHSSPRSSLCRYGPGNIYFRRVSRHVTPHPHVSPRSSSRHSRYGLGNIYFRHYRTRDGFLSVGCLSPRLNEKFRGATGLVDPRGLKGFDEDSETGKAAITLLKDEAEALFLTRDTSDWLDHLREHGVPCAQMNFPHEIFDDPQAIANGYVKDYAHHALGPYRAATTPLKMDKTPLGAPRPSPPLGAHTDEALAETGLDPEQIAKWRACGAIGRYDE